MNHVVRTPPQERHPKGEHVYSHEQGAGQIMHGCAIARGIILGEFSEHQAMKR